MNSTRLKTMLKTSFLMIFAATFFGFYFWTTTTAPHYFSWDMDLTTAQDVLLIRSGYLPDHMAHPGQGMLFVLNFIVSTAKALGIVSSSNLKSLGDCLVPLLGIAELTDLIRMATAPILFGIVLVLFSAFELLFATTAYISIVVFLFFATLIFTIFHATMLRTEQYAVLYWSLSILFSIFASIANKSHTFRLLLVLVGALLGLAFFTKIQVILLIATTLLFLWYLLLKSASKFDPFFNSSLRFYGWLTRFNFYSFTMVSASAFLLRIGDGIYFRSRYGITPWWMGLFIATVALHFGKRRLERMSDKVRIIAHSSSFLLFGLLLSLVTQLLMPNKFVINLRQLLLSFKVVFFGFVETDIMARVGSEHGIQNYSNNWALFAFLVISVFLLLRSLRPFHKNMAFVGIIAAIAGLVLVNTWVTLRSLMGIDIIWAETSLSFFSVFFLFEWLTRQNTRVYKKTLYIIIPLFGMFIVRGLANQYVLAQSPPGGMYNELKFYQNVYGGNQRQIKIAIDHRIGKTVDRNVLALNVRHYKRDLRDWREQVLNIYPLAKNMSYLQIGLPLTHDRSDCTVSKLIGISPNISTLDVSQPQDKPSRAWTAFIQYFGYSQHVKESYPQGQNVALYLRNDRKLMLFFERDYFIENKNNLALMNPGPYTMTIEESCGALNSTQKTLVYLGFELSSSVVQDRLRPFYLETERIKGSYFLAQIPSPSN